MCLCLTANAARQKTRHGSDSTTVHTTRSAAVRRSLPKPRLSWDSQKTYRVPVILMSFADCDFSEEHDQAFYNDLFNKPGFNLGAGPGCVADYFRDQSRGQFNVVFDVVGPIQLTSNQKNGSSYNYGLSQFRESVKMADEQLNYPDYDWDGDGRVESVIIVYAGYGGNEDVKTAEGCIWPNTDNLYLTLDGVAVGGYSASPELWTEDTSCGIGTICHEYCHVLGLPDLYPTSGSEFSVVDEWDLMDGGNYADNGWCPPNLSIQERSYLGWQEPEDLTEAKTIMDMPSFDSSGKCYRIVNDAYPSEYYLIENRQWDGWDFMLPNHGLLITHVDFNENSWKGNYVNSTRSHHRYEYFHADNFDFNHYEALYPDNATTRGSDGRNLRLQYTSYPYVDAEGVSHDALTDTSVPAAMIFNPRADGVLLMGKAVTDIQEKDGLISFFFDNAPALPGDANGDGVVNANDILTIVNYTMNMTSVPIDLSTADINNDGVVNVADIVMIVNIISKR